MKKTLASWALLVACVTVRAQTAAPESTPAERAVKLAFDNHCAEAMPLLDEAMRDSNNKDDTRRSVSYAGVMCSMLLNQHVDAISFLAWLQQRFPKDPDVLFLSTNVFAELSDRSAKDLMSSAPDSAQVVELNARNFERHGDFANAIMEYRILLQREPAKLGIHYRVGALVLAGPSTTENNEAARKEFEEELKTDPKSAGSEYYLGELDRQADKLPEAVAHFEKAVALQPGLGDAFTGLGRSLLDAGRTADSVGPLETAAKLSPENPTVFFALATAYQRLGRKEDAAREFEMQKSLAKKMNDAGKTLRKNIDGMNATPVGR